MIRASQVAGLAAAHAIWCVSDADGLAPILIFTTQDGQRTVERLVDADQYSAVQHGRRRLNGNPFVAINGVLAYDGWISIARDKLDAIVLEVRSYSRPRARATIAVPYSMRAGHLRINNPKLVEWEKCDEFDQDAFFDAFFEGVASHEPGAKVWNAAFDESK